MTRKIICDDSNNGFKEEFNEIVNLDIEFEGFLGTYRITMKARDEDFETFKNRVFENAERLLGDFSDEDLMRVILEKTTKIGE